MLLHRARLSACILILSTVPLYACVYTDADYTANSNAEKYTTKNHKNSGEIIISEQNIPDRQYEIIGNIEAFGRSVNLLSSDPNREDVNEALRSEAANQGADAVINVKYKTERRGLASRPYMEASGQAVIFTDK